MTTWSDEQIVEILHLKENEGMPVTDIAERFGTTKGSIVGLCRRVRVEADKHSDVGDGTMPEKWWKR